MTSILLSVFNMSVTAAIVILFVLLARLLLKKSPKIFSYALWAVVLFRLLCPVSVTTAFSLLGLFDAPVTETTEYTTAFEYVAPSSDYVPDAGIPSTFPSNVTTAPPGDRSGIQPEIPTQNAAPANSFITPLSVTAIVWLTGIGSMALYGLLSFVKVKRQLIGSVRLKDNIYLADHIDSPFVMGIVRPKIYLPSSLPVKEQGYIILHEQHHIRRCDHIIKGLAFLALCVHWFNPLVWLAFLLSSKDMEMSCDEAVLRKLGDEIRYDYSASLLSLATGRRIFAGTPLAFGEGDTKSRIRNLLSWKKPKVWITVVATIICITVVAACVSNPAADAQTGSTHVTDTPNPQNTISATGTSPTPTPTVSQAPASPAETWESWKLDGPYTEAANGDLYLRDLFGTALGDYGAELRLSTDGKVELYIGLLSGVGTWHADGDTGRFIADLVISPDEREETLTFYEFRESPESERYIVLEYDGWSLFWTQSDMTATSLQYLNDIIYYLELAAAGKQFQAMDNSRRDGIMAEYGDLLEDYTLSARESADGKISYIVGQYTGNSPQAPLKDMYSVEQNFGSEDTWQLLYLEEDSDTVEKALAAQKYPDVGLRITDSRILWSSFGQVVLIQPKNTELLMNVAWNRYLYTRNGREYITDAVSRGIDICGTTSTFLYVYRITEQFGEIAERIALAEQEAAAILAEEKVQITDGLGFSASLHVNGQTTYYNERGGIPQTVLDLAVERCDYRFGDPGMITDTIREAQLNCDWLDSPLYAKEEDLPRLREILKNAKHYYVGSCGYNAVLKLTFTGGEKLTVFKGSDSCGSIVFGSYGGYVLTEKEDAEFWTIFGLDPDTKSPIQNS